MTDILIKHEQCIQVKIKGWGEVGVVNPGSKILSQILYIPKNLNGAMEHSMR